MSPIWPRILNGVVKSGWQVDVLAPRQSYFQKKFFGLDEKFEWNLFETKSFRSPYRSNESLPRLVRKTRSLFLKKETSKHEFPDEFSSWVNHGFEFYKNNLAKNNYSLVISSSSPFSAHLLASKVNREFGLKWIADYRDLWSLNHAKRSYSPADFNFEKSILMDASGAITTSEGFSTQLSTLIPQKQISVIHNGYTDFNKNWKNEFSRPVKLIYPGQIYLGLQDFAPVLKVIAEINGNTIQNLIEIHFYGVSIRHIKDYFANIDSQIPSWIKFGRLVNLRKAIQIQRSADLLLLLNCIDQKIAGWMQTKLYEYIASGVPFIAFGGTGKDESSKLIQMSRAGFVITEEVELRSFLMDFLQSYNFTDQRNLEFIKQFERENQGKILASILESYF